MPDARASDRRDQYSFTLGVRSIERVRDDHAKFGDVWRLEHAPVVSGNFRHLQRARDNPIPAVGEIIRPAVGTDPRRISRTFPS